MTRGLPGPNAPDARGRGGGASAGIIRRVDPGLLLTAYARGLFPMDAEGADAPALYEADPRAVLPIRGFRTPRSVARAVRRGRFEVRTDTAFAEVAAACSEDRRDGMWLSPRLARDYVALHRMGYAHSVEAWRDGRLVGGLFGVALGGLFTSESMFHREPDAGSVALVATRDRLVRRGFVLWDIQMATAHTRRFGAYEVRARDYRRMVAVAVALRRSFGP